MTFPLVLLDNANLLDSKNLNMFNKCCQKHIPFNSDLSSELMWKSERSVPLWWKQ